VSAGVGASGIVGAIVEGFRGEVFVIGGLVDVAFGDWGQVRCLVLVMSDSSPVP